MRAAQWINTEIKCINSELKLLPFIITAMKLAIETYQYFLYYCMINLPNISLGIL